MSGTKVKVPSEPKLPVAPQYMDDYGAGTEGTAPEEQVVPYLVMLQGLSPQLDSGDPKFIKGAALGNIVNTATEEFYDGREGRDVIVCARYYHYGMWIPRALDGGFRGALLPNHQLVKDTIARMEERYGPKSGRFHMPKMDQKTRQWSDVPPQHPESGEDIELIEAAHLYILYGAPGHLTSENEVQRAIVGFKSTSLA